MCGFANVLIKNRMQLISDCYLNIIKHIH